MTQLQFRARRALVSVCLAAALAAEVCAQEAPAAALGGGTMPVQVVAGRLIVSCDLSTPANRIPANLFVELEGRHGLQLHNRAAFALRAEASDGTPRPITLHFQDFTFSVRLGVPHPARPGRGKRRRAAAEDARVQHDARASTRHGDLG
jgi:hypothetical protein